MSLYAPVELNTENLLSVLTNAEERNSQGKLAENQLKQWSGSPNFLYMLQSIYLDLSLPLQVRWLSVISFKNGVERFWRSCKSEEKVKIMERLFNILEEDNSQLLNQNAHAIARISRYEFPNNWKNLLDHVNSVLTKSYEHRNFVVMCNLLKILNQIIKMLNQVKIGSTKKVLQSKAPLLTPSLIQIYTSFFNDWFNKLDDVRIIDIDYLSLKILKRILPNCYSNPHKEEFISDFFKTNHSYFLKLLEKYKFLRNDNRFIDKFEKFIKCELKLYLNFINNNPTSFILIGNSTEIFTCLIEILSTQAQTIYNSNDDDENFWSTVAIKCLLILKQLVILNRKNEATLITSNISRNEVPLSKKKLTEFLTSDLIISTTNLIINWYLKLRPINLQKWSEEPEDFINDELNESWEYQIRPCSENFFQTLITNYKDLLIPFILNKITDINDKISKNGQSLELILLKDSIFAIIQLSGESIANIIDFDLFLNEILIPSLENSINNDELRIIKRRFCLIINEWVSIKCSRENRIKIYKILIQIIENNDDKVLSLSAINTLKIMIDDYDFQKRDFQAFSSIFISKLLFNLNDVETIESKMFVLNSLNSLLEKNGSLINNEELNNLLDSYPIIWKYFEDNYQESLMIKNLLIRILKNLIKCFKNSKLTAEISFEIIESCCDYSSEFYNVLSEDGFELWQTFLEYYLIDDTESNDLILKDLIESKFLMIYEPLVNTTEILTLILTIVRSYIILIPIKDLIMNPNLNKLLKSILKSASENMAYLRDDSLEMLLSILDTLFIKIHKKNEILETFLEILIDCEILKNSMLLIANNDSPSTVNKMNLLISRFFHIDLNLVSIILTKLFSNEIEIFKLFLNNWIINSNNFHEPRKRKQNLLGLSNLLLLTDNENFQNIIFIKENINLIFSNWSIFLDEINENEKGDCEAFYKDFNNYEFELIYSFKRELLEVNEDFFEIDETSEYQRYMKLIVENDPIHNTNMKIYIKNLLLSLENKIGNESYLHLLNFVDSGILENLQLKIQ